MNIGLSGVVIVAVCASSGCDDPTNNLHPIPGRQEDKACQLAPKLLPTRVVNIPREKKRVPSLLPIKKAELT